MQNIKDIQASTLLSLPRYDAPLIKGSKFTEILRLSWKLVAQLLIGNQIVFTKIGTQNSKGLFAFKNNDSHG